MPRRDGLQETEAESLVDISTEPATITIDGVDFTLKRLRLGDYAAAQEFIRDRKIDAILRKTGALSEDLRAKAIAEVLCRPMSLLDIWNEFEGECMMLHRGLLRGGKLVPMTYIMEEMEPAHRKILTDVLLYISGLNDPLDGRAEAPVENTSTPSAPNSGDKNSVDSAGTSVTAPRNS